MALLKKIQTATYQSPEYTFKYIHNLYTYSPKQALSIRLFVCTCTCASCVYRKCKPNILLNKNMTEEKAKVLHEGKGEREERENN